MPMVEPALAENVTKFTVLSDVLHVPLGSLLLGVAIGWSVEGELVMPRGCGGGCRWLLGRLGG
ncbi:hypothetical protein KO481_03610 [Nocardia sp. NEAU-G5]|uniref:Uncharacterized protein n=1 Tax=Nocardia albiluteola TaxID=2842303 RepID=A0ABS6ARF5_9NOCA|nr:hypothetical protein [Nocardia albiluteola]